MGTLEQGAKTAIDCLRLDHDSRVVAIIDEDSPEVKSALVEAIKYSGPADLQVFTMEEFGKRTEDPSDSRPPLEFPKRLRTAIEGCTHSMYAAVTYPQELRTFRMPLLNRVFERKIYHAHMPDISREMMEGPMCADYDHVKKISNKLHELLNRSEYVRMTNNRNANLKILLNNKEHPWDVDDGHIKPGALCNLPAGEVCTFPVSAKGSLYIDGTISGGLAEIENDQKDYREHLASNPEGIKAWFSHGDMGMSKREINNYGSRITAYLYSHFYASRIAEIGIGTNPEIKELTGIGLRDIKAYGSFHITVGMSASSPYQDQRLCPERAEFFFDNVDVSIPYGKGEKRIIKAGEGFTDIVTECLE